MLEKTMQSPLERIWSGKRLRDHLLADTILYVTCLSFIWLIGVTLN